MPKPGAWMTMVSAIFGVMMLGVAIWMLEKVISASTAMLLYSLLGIGFSLYLGAFEKDAHIFKRTVSVVLFIYSSALFVGFLAGGSSMLKPLEVLKAQSTTQKLSAKVDDELNFEVVTSIDELDKILAKNKGKKILLDFSAEWCSACKEFDEITFRDEKVRQKMKEFVLIRADLTKNTDKEKALSKKYGVFGPPVIVFFDKELNSIKSKMVVGYTPPSQFLKHLEGIKL
jgi:thiol:disulfide interchange protein DsbD